MAYHFSINIRGLMNQKESITILVSSAGSAAAINIIKALKLQNEYNIYIIATDQDKNAAGLFLADAHYLSPPITQISNYLEFMLNLCKKHKIKALFPTYSEEIYLFSKNKDKFIESNIQLLISSPETILLCNNKLKMTAFVKKLKIPIPSIIKDNPSDHLPLIYKPIQGSSSRNIQIIKDKDIFLDNMNKKKYFFQKYIEGIEYTVDILCDEDSNVIFSGPRKRLKIKSGQVTKSITSPCSTLDDYVRIICKEIKMIGICNIQFIENNNEYYFIEINPRCAAGGLMLTIKAGANLPLAALKLMLGYKIQKQSLTQIPNILMLRYWEELFIKG